MFVEMGVKIQKKSSTFNKERSAACIEIIHREPPLCSVCNINPIIHELELCHTLEALTENGPSIHRV